MQGLNLAIAESVGAGRKNFKYAQQRILSHHGEHKDGTDAQIPTYLCIHAGIGFSIVAPLPLLALHAGTGKAGIDVEPDSEIRGIGTGGSAADDLIASRQGDCGSGRAGRQTGVLHNLIENQIESQIGGQGSAAVRGQRRR